MRARVSLFKLSLSCLFALASASCTSEPRALVAGEDACRYCRMTIQDTRHGALVLTARGRLETFDAIECVASFVASLPAGNAPRAIWVLDYSNPGHWLRVEDAQFVAHSGVQSPMGRDLIAIAKGASSNGMMQSWADVVAQMQSASFATIRPIERRHESASDRSTDDTVMVSPGTAVPTIADGIRISKRNGTVRVAAAVYREPTIVVEKALTIIGDSGAVIDGEGVRELMVVHADSVTVRGMTFRNTGSSQATDRAALRIAESAGCLIEGNRFENTFFGIYLQKSEACLIRKNHLRGMAGSQTVTGNGIHLWSSRDVVIEDNVIDGHRDGVYFEFVTNAIVRRTVSTNSHRYGLHFMFSDSCLYEANQFLANESGVAVMYSKHVAIRGNRFERSLGSASYGLLLKEINDSEVRGNRFADNSVALHLEGSNRNRVDDNDFLRNGWAVRILADAQENMLRGNIFDGNVFDVGTNSRTNYSAFENNWWDRYAGYDLDHNGIGDVAHAPVRLFALLVEQTPAALVLTRSFLVDVLDVAERVIPALTPETLRDKSPLMKRPERKL